MARLWNIGKGNGDDRGVPTVKRRDFDGKVKEFVKVPDAFTYGNEQFVEHKPGNVYLALNGYQFFTIPKDAPFDVPHGVSIKAIQSMCPHLVTQEEYESLTPPAEEPKLEPKQQKKPTQTTGA